MRFEYTESWNCVQSDRVYVFQLQDHLFMKTIFYSFVVECSQLLINRNRKYYELLLNVLENSHFNKIRTTIYKCQGDLKTNMIKNEDLEGLMEGGGLRPSNPL